MIQQFRVSIYFEASCPSLSPGLVRANKGAWEPATDSRSGSKYRDGAVKTLLLPRLLSSNILVAFSGHNATQLLHRITKSKSLDSGHDWVYGDDRKLEYEYRLVCGQSYYGPDCDIICKPRHDNFGHYTCGPQGEKVCLEGWEKDNQNSARDDYCLKRKYYPSPLSSSEQRRERVILRH